MPPISTQPRYGFVSVGVVSRSLEMPKLQNMRKLHLKKEGEGSWGTAPTHPKQQPSLKRLILQTSQKITAYTPDTGGHPSWDHWCDLPWWWGRWQEPAGHVASRERCMLVFSSLPSIWSRPPPQGMVLPTLRGNLASPLKAFLETPLQMYPELCFHGDSQSSQVDKDELPQP